MDHLHVPRRLLLSLLILIAVSTQAQNVAINNDGSPPDPNAILDVKAKNKGILVPRMDSTVRLNLKGPIGLLVFDSSTKSFWFHDGKAWQNMATSGGWSLSGNSNEDSTSFLGTIDSKPLTIKVNNQLSGYIDANSTTGNTFWGFGAGSKNTIGFYNTANGFSALSNNTTGFHNTASGTFALYNNTTGFDNIAMGGGALYYNTNGSNNIAIGTYTMQSNTSGTYNIANGNASLTNNTTGNYNIALGHFTLFSNRLGNENTASGYRALYSHISGDYNTAIGSKALSNDTSGLYNTAIGWSSLLNNTDGVSNTAGGWFALSANTEGGDNTAFGIQSMRANTTGHYNTAIGSDVMWTNTTGQLNTVLGYAADVSANNLDNATAIGAQAVVNASNKVRIGNSTVTVIEGQVPFTNPSDGRFKFNIKEDVKGLDFILKLRPVTYQFDVQKEQDFMSGKLSVTQLNSNIHQAGYNEASLIRRTGFIAQEVEQAVEKSGYEFDGLKKPTTEKEYYSLSYASFVVPLVKAMQEQQKIIEEQKQLNGMLLKRLETLENEVQALKNK